MPQVDFYIIAEDSGNSRLLLACRLTEKAYNLKHHIYIHTSSASHCEQMDDLLWTFKQNSFVPHAVAADIAIAAATAPVLLGWQPENIDQLSQHDVLINLAESIPGFFTRFNRVIELVDQNEHVLKQSRLRFRQYREQGYEPASHKL